MQTRSDSRRDRRADFLRHLTLAFPALCALTSAARADIVREDFNHGIPASWTRIDYRMSDAGLPSAIAWGVSDPATFDNYTGADGLAAMADSDSAGDDIEYDIALLTPTFSLPLETGLSLSFTSNYQNNAHSDFADVDVRVAGSDTWINLLRWNEDHGDSFRNALGEQVDLSLDAFAGQDVEFRFHYYDPNANDWNWYWQVDNFVVTPAPGAATLGLLSSTLLLRRRRKA